MIKEPLKNKIFKYCNDGREEGLLRVVHVKSAVEWYLKYFSDPNKLMKDRKDLIYLNVIKEGRFKWDKELIDKKTKKIILYEDYDGGYDYDSYNEWLIKKAFEDVV